MADVAESNGTDHQRRLTAHDTQLALINSRLFDVEQKQDQTLMALGRLTTAIEKDQLERRAASWARWPVVFMAGAMVVLAGCELWTRLHG